MEKSIYTRAHKFMIEQLKKARKEAGLDQSNVAKLLGRSQSYVSKVERGQIRIDVIQLKSFAKIYKKKIDFFLK